jgi:hypothetical protein
MHDPAPRRDPSTPGEWLVFGTFLAIILALFVAEVFHDYTPVKLSALLVVAFWVPLLALHEAGHAIAAYALGWHVEQVVIGMGKTLGRFKAGTADVEIRLFPVEGFVRSCPTKLRLPGLENALIFAAGPGVELLLAGGILLLVGGDRLFRPSDQYWLIMYQSLALAAASQGILNLIPFAVATPQGDMASDGLGIILSLLRPQGYYAQMIGRRRNAAEEDWQTEAGDDW